MKIFEEAIHDVPDFGAIYKNYFGDASFAVFDIETTGLSPQFSNIILAGVITVDRGGATLHQFFAQNPSEEAMVIDATLDILRSLDFCVTYNGQFFDIPFLEKRALRHGFEMPRLFNLDLYNLFKYYSDIPSFLRSMSQKSLEEYAGIANLRSDRISGGESVDLYAQYLASPSAEIESRILLHNADDIRQLLRLMRLMKNASLERKLCQSGFPLTAGKSASPAQPSGNYASPGRVTIKRVDCKAGNLIIKGVWDDAAEYIAFPSDEFPYHMICSSSDHKFVFEIPYTKTNDIIYLDALTLLGEDELSSRTINGFLVIKNGAVCDYSAMASFAKHFTPKALARTRT